MSETLRVYQYAEDEFDVLPGKSKNGGVRLSGDGVELVQDPELADILVLPQAVKGLGVRNLRKLPHLPGRTYKHFLFDLIEEWPTLGIGRCIYVRGALRESYLKKEPWAISWPWPAEDYVEDVPLPPGGFRHDVGFVGWKTPIDTTDRACISVSNYANLSSVITIHPDFHGTRPKDHPETKRRRQVFRSVQRLSRLLLCPESLSGVFRYRFFEALSAGRIPVHIGSDYVLPWAHRIPWDDIAVFVDPAQVDRVGEICRKWLDGKTDEEIVERGRIGRQMYERYLDPKKWSELMTEIARDRLEGRI